jgi:hypothetical protein
MEEDKIILIAYHIFESSIGEYKDARLVMFPADVINSQAR